MSKTPTRAYGGVAAEQRAEERKARLLAAALELFARQGYGRTTIEALCSEAKVTARHFYQLFDSREAILRALYDNIIADLRAGVLKAMSAPELNLSEQIPLAVLKWECMEVNQIPVQTRLVWVSFPLRVV